MPTRLQRKRERGWRAPLGAIYVGRPGRYGNPYSVDIYGLELSLRLFANTARGIWVPTIPEELASSVPSRALAYSFTYSLHCGWLRRFERHPAEIIRAELRGKDLLCWCGLDQRCHADILLEIAND